MKKLYVGAGVIAALIAVLFTALPTILHAAGLHPVYEGPTVALPGKRALIITTTHSVLAAPEETEGPETGVMASEFTHPYYMFLDNGMTVDMASIQGGLIPIDPQTLSYPVSALFYFDRKKLSLNCFSDVSGHCELLLTSRLI